MDNARTAVRYGILGKCKGFSIAGRKNVLLIKGLIREALSFTSLFLIEGGRN